MKKAKIMHNQIMLKILSFFVLLMGLLIPFSISNAEGKKASTLVIHYFRYDQEYTKWAIWLWPEGGNGAEYAFTDTDDYGVYASIDVSSGSYASVTKAGILIKDSSWNKDVAVDRYIDLTKGEEEVLNIYLVQEDTKIGYSLDDPNGPKKEDKFRSAFFKTEKIISFSSTQVLDKDKISVYKDNEKIDATINVQGASGNATLNESVDLSSIYVIKAIFSDDIEREYTVTFDGIYDSDAFERAYGYTGDDLGVTINDNITTFKLWAPISNDVKLKLYEVGTPLSLNSAAHKGTNTPIETINMTKGEKGVWSASINSNLHGTYYTYEVTNGSSVNEVVDPYAKATGINGLRGLVVDFSKVNPKGWKYNNRAKNITNATDAIIYELHVRDLTSDPSWGGTAKNSGKYLGLCETGTKYNGFSTGFDHIKELGVTHVQLLPIFDYGVVDESRLTNPSYLEEDGGGFNWGYMPLNYNSLEGGYSSNPFDGLTAITEMKQVVMAYTANNIRINMDVVYNHTGLTADSNFNLIIPGYYHRLTDDGSFSNGSGCGNETASERIMMRKFMVDSIKFWATEYNFGGFRFDLMALHDVETMNEIANMLKSIDETLMIYGEPWNGGTTTLSSSVAADKVNLAKMPYVGAFNDDIRDGIKGSVFNAKDGGFIQGVAGFSDKVKYGIVGGINHPQLNLSSISYQKAWNTSPLKTINYVACHDNNTLYDKLMQTLSNTQIKTIEDYLMQANAIVLLSEGIPFIHAGDEIMRSKPLKTGGYDHNSYQSPQSVNSIKWNEKTNDKHTKVFNYYKSLINFRKNHASLRMTTEADIKANLSFINFNDQALIGYAITNNASKDRFEEMVIIFNGSNKVKITNLNREGVYTVVGEKGTIGETALYKIQDNTKIQILPNDVLVLVKNYKVSSTPSSSKGCSCSSGAVIALISSLCAIAGCGYFFLKNTNNI